MKTYRIQSIEICERCGGCGVMSNPLWQRFFAETKNSSAPDEDGWARENGYNSAADMGREAETCSECEGAGKITSCVPLEDALRELGVPVVAQG